MNYTAKDRRLDALNPPYPPSPVPTGWICPVCKCGVAPGVERCPCATSATPETLYTTDPASENYAAGFEAGVSKANSFHNDYAMKLRYKNLADGYEAAKRNAVKFLSTQLLSNPPSVEDRFKMIAAIKHMPNLFSCDDSVAWKKAVATQEKAIATAVRDGAKGPSWDPEEVAAIRARVLENMTADARKADAAAAHEATEILRDYNTPDSTPLEETHGNFNADWRKGRDYGISEGICQCKDKIGTMLYEMLYGDTKRRDLWQACHELMMRVKNLNVDNIYPFSECKKQEDANGSES